MAVVVVILLSLMALPSAQNEGFREQSSGVAEYEFVTVKECPEGLRDSGYIISPFGNIALKQRNSDGSITTPTCKGEIRE